MYYIFIIVVVVIVMNTKTKVGLVHYMSDSVVNRLLLSFNDFPKRLYK